MSKSEHTTVRDVNESKRDVWAVANEAFDQEDRIVKEAAEHFGVTEDYVRYGKNGRHTPEITDWMDQRFIEAGWEYRY